MIAMNYLARISLRGKSQIISNPHFWILVSIMLGLTFLYYSDVLIYDVPGQGWEWFWHLVVFEFNNDLHGSLFCIPLIYSALVFWWRGILITWLCSMAIILPRIIYYSPDVNSLVTNIFLLLIPLLVVSIITLQIKWRESEKKAAIEIEKERQAYIARIFKSQEDERKRISREVHDDTTQRLWIVANEVQKLAVERIRNVNPQAASELETIKDTMLNIAEDTKRLSLALRPGILDDLGLVPAIRWLVDQLERNGSVQAKVLVTGQPRQLDQDINNHLFRISQEALNNIRRHADATEVNVTLAFNKETVKMVIQDNGKGFSLKDIDSFPHQERLGIIGIQERARLLGSTLHIDSKPNKGTTISVEFRD